jgi:mannosyl-oligosaccharide glucosidase
MASDKTEVKKRKRDESNGSKPEPASYSSSKKSSSKQQDQLTSNQMLMFGSIALLGLAILGFFAYSHFMKKTVNIPFQDEEGSSPPSITYSNKKWGSFRPGHYFGMKSLSPFSVTTGLMWFRNYIDAQSGVSIRHECDRWNGVKYSWLKHDFDSFGIQKIVDQDLKINNSFIIHDESSWSSVVTVDSPNIASSIIFYVALDDQATHSINDSLEVESEKKFPLDRDKSFTVKGWSNSLGDFKTRITVEADNVMFKGFLATESSLVKIQETVTKNLAMTTNNLIVLRNQETNTPSNFIAHQIIISGKGEIRMDFVSSSEKSLEEVQDIDYEESLSRKEVKFSEDFDRTFRLKAKGFSAEEIAFAESTLSNLIGGVGYFHGSLKVSSSTTKEPLNYGPHSLLTATPSRSLFPRGFLWDEGFHQLLISRVIPLLSRNSINSWMSLMNIEGWIPREVILGEEAESRVPQEFIVQKNFNANPPTFFLTLQSMMDQGDVFIDDLRLLFPRLQAWYSWFNVTQVGRKEGTFRWRGRDAKTTRELNPKTLTSGLDDYPRASHPSDDEYHVDLRSWMTLASRVMTRISLSLGEKEAHELYKETKDYLEDNELLDQLLWSEEHGMYCDYGLHSREVKFVKKKDEKTGETTIEKIFSNDPSFSCVDEFGYVSLFPLLLQVLKPNNPRLEQLLHKMRSELLTDFGLRSLSPKSFFYDKYNTDEDPPYWRSNIWININFLALKSLHFYAKDNTGPYSTLAAQVYGELQRNVMKNVWKVWKETGFLWEHYSDKTGKGQGGHPFTGWSALIVLIMAEKY